MRMPCKSIKEVEERLDRDLLERDSVIQELQIKLATLESSKSTKIESIEKRVAELESEKERSYVIQQLHSRLIDDQNQYSRKTNLIIEGMNIKQNDNDKHIRNLVVSEIKRLDLDINTREVDRAHRTGKSFTDRNGKTHTSVVVRFTSWYARNCLYEARKDSRFFIKADLTSRRQDLLEWARDLHENVSRASDLLKYICADRNCHLTVKTCDDRYLRFNSKLEFENLLNFIEDSLPPFKATFFALESSKKKTGDSNILVNLSGIDVEQWVKDPNNYYIGRGFGSVEGSLFQNPYSTNDYDRKTAIQKFREHIRSNPELMAKVVPELKHKTLGCYCWPEDCHGHVLLNFFPLESLKILFYLLISF